MNNKFCPLPWIFQAVRNNGDIRVCCQANPSKSKGIYRKKDGTAYNARYDNLDEARNSDLAKEIRLSMLEGNEHEACIRCDREDASGINSRRQYENELWKHRITYEDAVRVTKEDGSIDTDEVPVLQYDLRFGNFCNLKCRMCGPTDSHMWYEDHVKVWNEETFQDSHGNVELIRNSKNRYIAKYDDYNWVDCDKFWKQIDKNIPNIEQIHTVGGEPLLIDKHYDLLQRCIDLGYSKNITVEYNSNLVNIPQRAWNLWPHFKQIKIGASIDAIGPLNDYIRHPSNFNKLAENLHKLDKIDAEMRIWIACTVQVYNVAYLDDFMKWIIEQNFKTIGKNTFKPIISPHPLHNPAFLNTKILPKEAKDWIRVKYDNFYIWLEEYLATSDLDDTMKEAYRSGSKKVLESYYDIMTKEDWSQYLLKFWNYTKSLDKIRNESFEDAAPELYEIIKRHVE